jgi:chromate transport protein ChrA
VALGIYVVVTLIYLASAPRDRLSTHTPFNHFALLADGWKHHRLDLGGPPPAYTGNNDFAVFEGKTFVSFPPFPAVLLVPLVLAADSAERVKDGLFFLMLAGVGPAVLFLALEKLARLGRSPHTERTHVALALLFAFGTVYWFSAVQGTVWFAAHVVGAALGATYLYASIDAEHPFLAGLALGLGFATRTPLGFALPLFLYEALHRGDLTAEPWSARLRRLALFAAPAGLVLLLLLWHNAARFHDPLEFGHRLLAIGWRARIEHWGLFSYHYLGRNLAVVLTSLPYLGAPNAPFQINGHGLALWITSPFYAWALWPRRTSAYFWVLAMTVGAIAAPSLLYQNSGWVQFGYRFSNDFAPFIFVMIAIGGRRLSTPFWTVAALAVVLNGFGALTFQRAGFERFYFIDGTQRILHQPD